MRPEQYEIFTEFYGFERQYVVNGRYLCTTHYTMVMGEKKIDFIMPDDPSSKM